MLHSFLFSVIFYVSTYADLSADLNCQNNHKEVKCNSAISCVWQSDQNQITPDSGLCVKAQPNCNTGIRNWDISYEAKPIQFKFYDACEDDTAIIIKLQELTEYKSSTSIKTSNTQILSDVKWDYEHGIYKYIQGNTALTNGFQSSLMNTASNFKLNTILFSDNSMQFNIHINNWQYLSTDNYLVLCMQMMTANEYEDIPSSDTNTLLNGFEISTDNILCNYHQISIVPTILRSDKNTLDICYNIDPCVGDINWSTKISYDSKKLKEKHLPVVKTTDCGPNDIRYRKDWLEMSTEERSLFIEGFQKIRDNGKLDTITEAHSVHFMGRLHESSLFLYYHSYIIWETESAIRDLGGKYSCFAMPFYDWTKDFGLENDPQIFHTGIGGDGSLENYCVTEDESDTEFNLFPSPNLCSSHETTPNCCLKRLKSKTQRFVNIKKLLTGMKYKNAEDFDKILRIGHSGFHRFFGDIAETHMHTGYATDDPIFHLLHSYMDLLRVVWQDCNEYTSDYSSTGIVKYDENAPVTDDMYHEYCYGDHENTLTTSEKAHQSCNELQKFIHVDDELMFFGLARVDWTVVGFGKNKITIRNLFNINFNSRWKVMYDVGGFYDDYPSYKEWCDGDRSEEVDEVGRFLGVLRWEHSSFVSGIVCGVIVILFLVVVGLLKRFGLVCFESKDCGDTRVSLGKKSRYGTIFVL